MVSMVRKGGMGGKHTDISIILLNIYNNTYFHRPCGAIAMLAAAKARWQPICLAFLIGVRLIELLYF